MRFLPTPVPAKATYTISGVQTYQGRSGPNTTHCDPEKYQAADHQFAFVAQPGFKLAVQLLNQRFPVIITELGI